MIRTAILPLLTLVFIAYRVAKRPNHKGMEIELISNSRYKLYEEEDYDSEASLHSIQEINDFVKEIELYCSVVSPLT